MAERNERWPDHSRIAIHGDGVVTYHAPPAHGRIIGQVMPTGQKWNGGKDNLWTNGAGGLHHTAKAAAYEVAILCVRNKLPYRLQFSE